MKISGNLLLPAFFLFLFCSAAIPSEGKSLTRDLQVDVFVNQLGYLPGASKRCVLPGDGMRPFQVIHLEGQRVVATGELEAKKGDFGAFLTGDFSQVQEPGAYYVRAGRSRSYPFRIGRDVYDSALETMVDYFSLQRCGPSTTGYLAPCHTDDGVRLDNGKRQDVTGGWHDASDLRKWVGATIHGVIGLARLSEALGPSWHRERILDEIRWGNRYFLRMQEPAGYVMSHIGGDVVEHGDSNRWTDNVIGAASGSVKTVDPAPGGSSDKMTVAGEKDDRVIQTRPLDRIGQYKFVIAEAAVARLTRASDAEYSDRCLSAAKLCFDWCRKTGPDRSTRNLGGALAAATELWKATRQADYREFAVDAAARVTRLQVTEPIDADVKIHGFFRKSPDGPEPYRDIWHGCWHLIGLLDLIEAFPSHEDVETWRKTARSCVGDYLEPMSRRNRFGIVPYGFYAREDPGGNRKIGECWYRYFMRPEGWWVGVNANLASAGVALAKAACVLENPRLVACAQSQLDWILGVNPHGASTVVGIGYNHPERFVNGNEFRPATPVLPGAVMNGLGGTAGDQPDLCDGSYHTAEYWTPMVSYTLWLMAELKRGG
jgi:hypothetical protein